jgi:hypothetical protein
LIGEGEALRSLLVRWLRDGVHCGTREASVCVAMFLERADWLVVSVSFIQSLLFASRSGPDPLRACASVSLFISSFLPSYFWRRHSVYAVIFLSDNTECQPTLQPMRNASQPDGEHDWRMCFVLVKSVCVVVSRCC